MSKTIHLTLDDVRDICFEYAKTTLAYDESIPNFNTRLPNRLESVLAVPSQTFGGEFVYKTLEKQAAVLFYHIAKAHAFVNGNKRIACVSLMAFLRFNNKWIRTNWKSLYRISVLVADSKPEDREKVIKDLTDFIEKSIIDY